MKIFCVIPAYNENRNLPEIIKQLDSILARNTIKYEIFFVIQGNDGSCATLEEIKKTNDRVCFISFPKPLGIGLAYKIGFEHIKDGFTHILTLDADLNHDPESLPAFIKKMNEIDADIVMGSRFTVGGAFKDNRKWKRIMSFLVNKLITLMLNIEVHDVTSGYRLMKRKVIEKVRADLQEKGYPGYMEFIIRAKRKGFKITEVPIIYAPRRWGKSKMGKLTTFLDYLKFINRIALCRF